MISKKALGMVFKVLGKKELRSSKENSKKGFTLVELIVVLAIIGILAVAVGPVLLGYIDNINEKKYITEAKEALSVTQAILSDAYTNGNTYLSKPVRSQALDTSGLDPESRFVVWTVKRFTDGDGTYNTIGSYTVDKALYESKDGVLVYFDGSEWSIVESTSNQYVASVTDDTKAPAADDNYIVVWPITDTLASNDTASYIPSTNPDDGENEETAEEIAKKEDEENHNPIGEDIEEEEPERNPVSQKVVYVHFDATNGSYPYFATFSNGGSTFDVTFKSGTGFVDSNGDSITVTPTYNSFYYIDSNPIWKVTQIGDTILEQPTELSGISAVITYLNNNSYTLDKKSITVVAELPENEINVPVSFLPYDETGETLTVKLKSDSNDENSSVSGNTVTMKYNMVTKSVSTDFVLSDAEVSVSEDAITANADARIAIEHDGYWYEGKDNQDIDSVQKVSVNASDANEQIKQLVSNWVDENLKTPDTATDDTQRTMDVKDIEESGLDFYAPADIKKTVYIIDTTDSVDFDGSVDDVSENENNDGTEVSNDGTNETNDDDNISKISEFSVSFVKNEYTGQVYDADDVNNKTIVDISSYSIFRSNGMDIAIDGKLFFKYWYLYDCKLDKSGKVNKKDSRAKDCTEDLLNKLYNPDNNYYCEIAEIDIAKCTSKLDSNITNNDNTPIQKKISQLAGGAAKVKGIYYTSPDAKTNYSSSTGEVCLSTTVAALDTETGKYMISKLDPDYPAYTIAYKVPNGDGFDIYIFSEDDSFVKAEKSFKGMCEGFTNMTQDTFVSKMDTSGVTSLENAFKTSGLTSIDLSEFDTSNVTTMRSMFDSCSSLTSADINLDMSHTANLGNVFRNSGLVTTGTTGINISSATTIEGMFDACVSLENVVITGNGMSVGCPLSNVNNVFRNSTVESITIKNISFSNFTANSNNSSGTLQTLLLSSKNYVKHITIENVSFPNVKMFDYVFSQNSGNVGSHYKELLSVKIKNIDAPSLIRAKAMFYDAQKLQTVTFSGFNAPNLGMMSLMFYNCYRLTSVDFGNVGAPGEFNTSKVTEYNDFFRNCYSIEEIDLSGFETPNMISMTNAFDSCYSLKSIDLSPFNTAMITSNNSNKKNGLFQMFGTTSADSVNNKTASALTTIYVSDQTVTAFTKYPNIEMFGDKLVNLEGGNGTKFTDIAATDNNNKKSSKYAQIDSDTKKGYLTRSESE